MPIANADAYLSILTRAFEKHYRENSDVWTEDPVLRGSLAIIQSRIRLKKMARMLDIGCGTGQAVEHMATLFGSIVGIDICRHTDWDLALKRHSNITFLCTNFLSYTSANDYDLILDSGCFHHQHPEHYTTYLNRVAELMHEESIYVLTTYKGPHAGMRVDPNGRIFAYFSDVGLHSLLRTGGLVVRDEVTVSRGGEKGRYRVTFSSIFLR